ncbi:general transcription factor 3C polypeptide 5-like [Argonauta hians]
MEKSYRMSSLSDCFGNLPNESVPIHTNRLNRKIVCIEYPGIVKNVSRAMETLGGLDEINKRYVNSNQRLELRWRPTDPYCKSSYGDSSNTNNLMFRFKRRKRKKLDGSYDYEHKVEIMGVVKVTFRFQGMVDFQYLPMMSHPTTTAGGSESQGKTFSSIFDKLVVNSPEDIKDWLKIDVPLFLPPIIFSRMDSPMEYLYKSEMQHRSGFVNPQDQRPSNLIGTARQRRSRHTIFVNFEDKTIPTEPMRGAAETLRAKVKNPNLEDNLRELFRQKPIWSRNGICGAIDCRRDTLKYVLPLVAYYFITGPWRSLWVQFGYDPRKDPASKKYQIVDFRVRQRGTNAGLDIKAKRSTFSYKLPTVITKQTGQVATINRSGLLPGKDLRETTSCSKEEAESTYKFRPHILPPFRQMFYQISDILDDDVQGLLNQNNGQETVCDEKDGWCIKEMNDKCREIMYNKLNAYAHFGDCSGKKTPKKKPVKQLLSTLGSSDESDSDGGTGGIPMNEMETEMLDCV